MLLSNFAVVAALLAATGLSHKTLLSGDVVGGIPVITKLDLSDVPVNAITRYYFQAAEAQGTIKFYIPVFVARGTKESLETGRRLSLSSTVHGDEYNGVRVVQKVFANLEHQVKGGKLNGTIIGIPTVNVNGINHNQRNCKCLSNTVALQKIYYNNLAVFSSSENGFYTNLNRIFPSNSPKASTEKGTLPKIYVENIWNGIWGNTSNVDIAVDMRTEFST